MLLTGPAQAGPGGGMAVTLASSNTNVLKVPPLVQVPAGAVAGKFTFITFAVGTPTDVTITATLAGATKTGTVKVVPAQLLRLEIPSASIRGGAATDGRVVLSGLPATAAQSKIYLKSANPALVKVPDSVTVEATTIQATFKIETFGVTKETPVVVTASQGGAQAAQKTDTLTLLPTMLKSLDARGCPGPCTGSIRIQLDGKMPAEGLPITLTSSHPSLATVSQSLSVAAGSDPNSHVLAGSFTAPEVHDDKTVTITATLGSVSKKDEAKILNRARPDLFISSKMRLVNHLNVEVERLDDSQPFTMCARVGNRGNRDRGGHEVPPSALTVTHRHSTNSSLSRSFFTPVPGAGVGGVGWGYQTGAYDLTDWDTAYKEVCFGLPGIEKDTYLDVELEADGRKEINETRESNNDRRFRVERK